MKNKRRSNKLHLILAFSAAVFLLIIVAAYWLFIFYFTVKRLPFISVETLPHHSADIILGIFSILLGIILSVFFKKLVLNPLYEIYEALDEISQGNFDINIPIKGISTIKDVSKKINATATELESLEKMRNDFIDNFSHEFKTPIISISGFAKILKNDALNAEEKKEYLDIIITESDRLAMLATNVLNLTKLDNQSMLYEITRFNISEQIRLAVVLLEYKWSSKKIDISLTGDECYIYANEETLKQLWINLIENAIKFSPEGSSVEIDMKKNNDFVNITVRDHGSGMDEETKKHAFDRFYQGDVSHKSNGNGIGLAIAKKICELHNGSISIKETGTEGTTFLISLPVNDNIKSSRFNP